MRNQPHGLRRAAAALLAAAALPLAPLAAQEAQPAADPPAQAAEQPAPEAAMPAPTPAPPEPEAEPAPAPEAQAATPPATARAAPATRRAPARAPVRATARPAPRAIAPAAPAASVPVAAAPVPAPVADSASGGGVAAVPPGEVETLPVPPEGGTDIVPTAAAPAEQNDGSILPWLIGGLLLAGALAYLLLRRRRTEDYVEDDRVYEEPAAAYTPAPEPVIAPEPVRAPEPVAAAPTLTTAAPVALVGGSILTAPIVGTGFAAAAAAKPAAVATPVETAPVAAAATQQGAPEIDLSMRAIRAGVQEDGARVEFELTVGNSGPVSAEDVRVSTWMLASGASETERALIAPADHADTPPVTIPAGETRTLQAAVGLTSAEVTGDAVLPVVVADATYRLPDGSTGHATARFAVGVPDGEELAHFSTDNPSGLHEGVVARELG
jgi:hypothetical protein